jgi:hypothetical protein
MDYEDYEDYEDYDDCNGLVCSTCGLDDAFNIVGDWCSNCDDHSVLISLEEFEN